MKKNANEELVYATLYKHIIGPLRYLCNNIPDIFHSVSLVSRFIEKPRLCHLLAAKRILKYIQGITNHGILIATLEDTRNKSNTYDYPDSDWGGNQDDGKITAGYLFMFEATQISWSSKKQVIINLLCCKVEYVATSYTACQTL